MTVSARELTERPRYLILNGKKKSLTSAAQAQMYGMRRQKQQNKTVKQIPLKRGWGLCRRE